MFPFAALTSSNVLCNVGSTNSLSGIKIYWYIQSIHLYVLPDAKLKIFCCDDILMTIWLIHFIFEVWDQVPYIPIVAHESWRSNDGLFFHNFGSHTQ